MIWDDSATVARFVDSPPNQKLMEFAAKLMEEFQRPLAILDIGCGAGRNALPLARLGHNLTGIDRSGPMLEAARNGAQALGILSNCRFLPGEMERLDFPDASFDLVIAHGIWNLAGSDSVFLQAVGEAGRVAHPGAGLFVFTFARIAGMGAPESGRRFAELSASGNTHCFVSEVDLCSILEGEGFRQPPGVGLTLYNAVRKPGLPPPIFEGQWRKEA